MKAILAIFELTGLVYKMAIVIIAAAVIIAFVRGCATNATLDEHSSCQQFEQADTTTQNTIVNNMQKVHQDTSGTSAAFFSITLYCNVHSSDAPIDGIYNGGN